MALGAIEAGPAVRIDLFELIEGFFSGVIFFLYNAVWSIVQLVRRPFSAPLRLYLRHRSRERRQIGGLTFLFLLFFMLMLILVPTFSETDVQTLSRAGRAVIAGEFDGGTFWPVVVSALIGTTIVDAMLRLVIKTRLRDRPVRAETTLGAIEFAYLMPLLGLGGLILVPAAIIIAYDPPGEWIAGTGLYTAIPAGLIGLVLFSLAPLPPLALLHSGLRPLRRSRPGLPRRWVNLAGGVLAIWLLTLTACIAALAPAIIRIKLAERAAVERMAGSAKVIDVIELDCRLEGDRPYVDALLLNRTERPTLLRPRELEVMVGAPRLGVPEHRFRAWDVAAPPVLIQPGATIFARFRLRPVAGFTRTGEQVCWLRAPSREGAGNEFIARTGGAERGFVLPR